MTIETVVEKKIQRQTSIDFESLQSSTFQEFFHKFSHGGYLLYPAAILAILWANINPSSYNNFWPLPLIFSLDSLSVSFSLAHWVNDVLMTFFFFTVALKLNESFWLEGFLTRRISFYL